MNLREFVSETLVEVVEGIVIAQKKLSETDVRISPRVSGTRANITTSGQGRIVERVDFDIAVTITEGAEHGVTIGVLAGVFGAGAKETGGESSAQVSRVRFAVPVTWPTEPTER